MSEELTFGVAINSASDGSMVADARASRDEMVNLKKATEELATSAGKMASQYSGLNVTVKEHSAAVTETDGKVVKLLDRYDPLGAKLRQLQADFKALDQAAAGGRIAGRDDSRVDAVYAKLQQEIKAASDASVQFGTASGAALENTALMTHRAQQEFMVLGRELASGNMSRVPGTLSIIAQGLSPVALGVGAVTAALATGAYAWYKWGDAARDGSLASSKVLNDMKAALEAATEGAAKSKHFNQVEQIAEIDKQISALEIENNKKLAELEDKKRVQSMGSHNKMLDEQIKYLESTTIANNQHLENLKRNAQDIQDVLEKQAGKSAKAVARPNDTAVLKMQNEEFKRQMELIGIAAPQIAVYELAMKGATKAQTDAAQAAANGTMAADAAIRAKKDEEAANKAAAKSSYELSKAHEAEISGLIALDLQYQLRNADMLTGIERDQAMADVQLQITMNSIGRQHDAQVAALEEKRRLDMEHHALSLALEKQYQEQFALMDEYYQAQLTNAKAAEDQKRLKNEQSVVNVFANLRKGDYMNAMSLAQQMSAGLATHSRAAFEVNKAVSLANATIKGYEAVQNAFADGSKSSYWYGIAEAALAAVYAGAQISAISGTQFGGGGGISAPSGGGGIPSLATSPGIPVSPQPSSPDQNQQPVQVTIYNNYTGNVLSPDYIENNVISQIQDAVKNKDVLLIDPRSRQAQVLAT